MEDINRLRREFKHKFGVSLPEKIAAEAIGRIGLDRALQVLSRIGKGTSNPIGYFKRSVDNEPVDSEPAYTPDDEPFVPEEYEYPYMSKLEFQRWYFERYPEAREFNSIEPRKYDLESFSDLKRYRDLYLSLRDRILAGDPNVWDTPVLQRLRDLFFDMFPQGVWERLHPRAKAAALYGYLIALEERGEELPGDQSIEKEVQPPRGCNDHLEIRGIPSLDDDIPF